MDENICELQDAVKKAEFELAKAKLSVERAKAARLKELEKTKPERQKELAKMVKEYEKVVAEEEDKLIKFALEYELELTLGDYGSGRTLVLEEDGDYHDKVRGEWLYSSETC